MEKYIKEQRSICDKYKAEYVESPNDLKLGIAQNVKDGIAPINGLRMPIENGTTGWYIWAGEEMGTEEDFFLYTFNILMNGHLK